MNKSIHNRQCSQLHTLALPLSSAYLTPRHRGAPHHHVSTLQASQKSAPVAVTVITYITQDVTSQVTYCLRACIRLSAPALLANRAAFSCWVVAVGSGSSFMHCRAC